MGSNVKATSAEKQKIDIEINIENNLFSKNKCCGKECDKKGKSVMELPQVEIGEKIPSYVKDMYAKKGNRNLYLTGIKPRSYTLNNRYNSEIEDIHK